MGILLLIFSVVAVSLGQVTLKKAAHSETINKKFEKHHLSSILNYYFLISLLLLGSGTIFWLLSLSTVDLSIANPFNSLSYVIVLLLSRKVFHEEIPKRRWIGITLIIIGIVLISNS